MSPQSAVRSPVCALLPLLPIEPLLIGASVSVPAPLLPVVALSTAGHMTATTLLYFGGRAAAELRFGVIALLPRLVGVG